MTRQETNSETNSTIYRVTAKVITIKFSNND